MPHNNSVLHEVLKHIPDGRFEALVEAYRADERVRQLSTRSQLIAMAYGQLSGAPSLRTIVADLDSHAARLYHVGCDPVRRSTLAEANRTRPAALFGALLEDLMAQAHRGLRRHVGESIHLIDSTSVRLSPLSASWSRFSAKACGAKTHVVYDPDADRPIYAAVTKASVNDITAAQAMPITAGATYVFDLGYYDYRWWARLHKAGCRIVTRFRASTPLTVTATRPVPWDGSILSDRVGLLPERQAGNRRNPFQATVREVRVRLETGKILRILSNDLTLSARQIADLYKRRWAIELFFRWVKQTLRIRKFFGTSENAIRIQIAVALIVFILLRLAQATQSAITSPLLFARLVRTNLMHGRRIDQLIGPQSHTRRKQAGPQAATLRSPPETSHRSTAQARVPAKQETIIQ